MHLKNERSLENLVDKMMIEMQTETTSVDFTTNLMMRVQALPSEKHIVYQPLISKTGWILIVICLLALLGLIMLNADNTKSDWFNIDGMNHFLVNISQGIKVFQFSTISTYAVVFTTVMFFVQIHMLVNRYQKSIGLQ
jgi:hypothetical protein